MYLELNWFRLDYLDGLVWIWNSKPNIQSALDADDSKIAELVSTNTPKIYTEILEINALTEAQNFGKLVPFLKVRCGSYKKTKTHNTKGQDWND